ncbi:hypothetical protein HPB51_023154 [Rhipicephalus microplus]|uniref:Uncharacterized protein n=1 Tax=Rhipicephalus microplus TaxID=6941 RepID=A0A9J6DJV8_RHIMP|nr:hypothetical protein HPB51_023154 [Rhipicephalus microplus]
MDMTPERRQAEQVHNARVSTVPSLTVYTFPSRWQDFDPNCIRLVTRAGDRVTAVACLIGFIKRFCGAQYYKVLEGSDEDGLWLEPVKIDRRVLSQQPWIRMTGPEPPATMDDVYVLFGVLLCNLHSEAGTIFNRDWFQSRVNDLVQLFPGVSVLPAVPPYSVSQADALSAFGKQWPFTTTEILCTIIEGRFQVGTNEASPRICVRTVENRRDCSGSTSKRSLILVEYNLLRIRCNCLQVTAPMVPAVLQTLQAATNQVPAAQGALQCKDYTK